MSALENDKRAAFARSKRSFSPVPSRVGRISSLLGFLRGGFASRSTVLPSSSDRQLVKALTNNPLGGHQPTLSEISRLLSGLDANPATTRADKLCGTICKLNELAQAALTESWANVLDAGALESAASSQQALVAYYRTIHAACLNCQHLADREMPDGLPRQFHAILGTLAINALAMEKKLLRFCYFPADRSWWTSVHFQLNRARRLACDAHDLSISHTEATSSPMKEYKFALFFELAPLDSLTFRQMEALDRTLREFEKYLPFLFLSAGSESYCVDTASAEGPTKLLPDSQYALTVGYVGFDLLRPPLQRLIQRMKRGFPYPDFLASSQCTRSESLSMLEALVRAWSGEPQRQQTRHLLPASINIGLGLAVLHQTLSDEVSAAPTISEGDNKVRGERLHLLNVSEQGIGVELPHCPGKFTVGALVSFRFEALQAWRVGIIRRLSRHDSGLSSCGIEQFAGQFVPARMAVIRSESGSGRGNEEILDAVLQAGMRGQEHCVLLPRGAYKEGRRYRLCARANASVKDMVIKLTRLVDGGTDFERAAFVVLAMETPGALDTASSCPD